MFLTKLKANALLLLGALATFAALLARIFFLQSKSEKLEREAETFKAKAHHANTVIKKDVEAEVQSDLLNENLAEEIKRNDIPTAFDPNKLRDDT